MTTTLPPPQLLPQSPLDIYYPESDGQPVAESDVHRQVLLDTVDRLDRYFADQPDVYVSGNLLLYYQEGNPRVSVSPDVFVARSVPKGRRRIYRVWLEGKGPDWVLELTSPTTRSEDLGAKFGLYQHLGVQEYVLFDPLDAYLRPRFQAFELRNGRYEPMELTPEGSVWSPTLGLELQPEGEFLRLFDRANGQHLRTSVELETALEAEAAARRAAEAARQAAESEVVRLRAEIEQLRGGSAR